MVGVTAEWKTLNERERSNLYKQLIRRVAVSKQDDTLRVVVHPVWEPDPWQPIKGEVVGRGKELTQ